MEQNGRDATASAEKASPVPADGNPGKEACYTRFQRLIGFKERSSTIAWVSLAVLLIGFCISVIRLAFPGGSSGLAPGEEYHHRTREVRLAIHVVSIILWSVLGLIQFIPKVRKVALEYHRWGGRVYLISAAVLAITGLLMSPYSFGGHLSSQTASIMIFLTFVVSAVMGLIRVKQGYIQEHRGWMLRNYAAGTSVLWSRITTPLGIALAGLNDYWMAVECGQVRFELRDKMQEVYEHFPQCMSLKDEDRVVVSADGPTDMSLIVSARMGFDIGLWLGLIFNMAGIELWIRYCNHLRQKEQEKVSNIETIAVDGGESGKATAPAPAEVTVVAPVS